MALTIEWTPKAIDGYISILQYIESNFGYSTSKKYAESIESTIQLISKFSGIGSVKYPELKIRSFVINKKTSIYYLVESKTLKILYVLDNRMDRDAIIKGA